MRRRHWRHPPHLSPVAGVSVKVRALEGFKEFGFRGQGARWLRFQSCLPARCWLRVRFVGTGSTAPVLHPVPPLYCRAAHLTCRENISCSLDSKPARLNIEIPGAGLLPKSKTSNPKP